jgi:hypothetical protein
LVRGADDAPLDEVDSLTSVSSDDDDERFSITSSDSEATDNDVEHALLTEALPGDCEVCLSCLPHLLCSDTADGFVEFLPSLTDPSPLQQASLGAQLPPQQ